MGTTSDPVTIQNASDDSDNSSTSESNHDQSGMTNKPNHARQSKKVNPNKPGVYPAPEQETE